MAVFKELTSEDVRVSRDVMSQLVDVLQTSISGSNTRKSTQIWASGGIGPGVTSSFWQTTFDQDFTLQTANPIFDMTVGLSQNSALVQTGSLLYVDANTGKYYFSSQSLMMREKMDIYRAHAQSLLGDIESEFTLVSGSTQSTVREALFIDIKRLFHRDAIKRETFGIKLYQTASALTTQATDSKMFSDVGSNANQEQSFGGQVSTVVDSTNTSYPVGLLYLDKGILVLDTQRVFDTAGTITGTIHAVNTTGTTPFSGTFNKFLVSASVDDIIDHVATTRFSSGSETAMAFQNQTSINSTLFFCRMAPGEFNYSSNPTYVDNDGRIVVIDPGQEDTQRTFTFITSIGLYDSNDNCLAIGKFSRPIFKDNQRDMVARLRMDF